MKRRQIIAGAAAFAGASLLRTTNAKAATGYRAVAFDGLALFDTRPIGALVSELVPEKGVELANLWRVKQFDYQWLSALSGHYRDFEQATAGALAFAARSLKIDLAPRDRERLLHAWLELKPWPDVPAALQSLKRLGLRLAPLANFTPAILERAVANPGLDGVFEQVISTDRRRTFKPDPRAYQLGVDVFGIGRDQIVFVASAGWDVAGARWFGYPTFWVNRNGAPAEELGVEGFAVGRDMKELVEFVRPRVAR